MSTITLPPMTKHQRSALRSLVRAGIAPNKFWRGTPVSNLKVEQIRDALEETGYDQARIDQTLARVASAASAAPVSADIEDTENEDMEPEEAADTADTAQDTADLPADASAMWRTITGAMSGGDFACVDTLLTRVLTAARKPAVTIERVIEVPTEAAPNGTRKPRSNARVVERKTAGELFKGLRIDPMRGWKLDVYQGGANVPAIDPLYRFDQNLTARALAYTRPSMPNAPLNNLALVGPAGTGKSSWFREFAAQTGRGFVLLSCCDGLELADLLGSRVLLNGTSSWADGALLSALREPGCVIVFDEVAALRENVAIALNAILQERRVTVSETGEQVAFAPGIMIGATNNDLLVGTTSGKAAYTGLKRLSAAFADRFRAQILVDYPTPAIEAGIIMDHVPGASRMLADLLVKCAGNSRGKANRDEITRGIGLRRLMAWADGLHKGLDPKDVFCDCVLHYSPEQDHEALREIAASGGVLRCEVIDAARAGRDPATAPAEQPSDAMFSPVTNDDTE